jgi:hypothetical protein
MKTADAGIGSLVQLYHVRFSQYQSDLHSLGASRSRLEP